MSYTRKVTVIREGCPGSYSQRTVTVTQTSSSTAGCDFKTIQEQFVKNIGTPKTAATPVQSTPTKLNSAGSISSSSNSSKDATPFEVAVLGEHNRLRAKHSAPPLTLNPAISRYAQEWANNLAARNTMQHRTSGKYGENLYACFGKVDVTGEEAVRSWYNEIKDYRFGQSNPSNFSQVGHFTQVVWKSSRELGVGIAKNGKNVYVVCNYDPPGNFSGKYPDNVSRS